MDLDEENTSDAKVISASFADPYALTLKNDQSISVFSIDESGDIEEIQGGNNTEAGKWVAGSLFDDANDTLRLEFDDDEEVGNVLLFLVTVSGGLHVSAPYRDVL